MTATNRPLLASLAGRARATRWSMLIERFPSLDRMRVLDMGGEVSAWRRAPVQPRELVLLNLPPVTDFEPDVPWATQLIGDACDPPADLQSESFDLVYCNSVIEHVGGHHRRIQLADAIDGLGEHHWVQTPFRYFPLEQHAVFPALQFLPVRVRAGVARHWPIGNLRQTFKGWPQTASGQRAYPQGVDGPEPLEHVPVYHAVRGVLSIELLSTTEMRFLFPRSQIVRERFAGLTKSLIAVR
jgi:hypothetical protein